METLIYISIGLNFLAAAFVTVGIARYLLNLKKKP